MNRRTRTGLGIMLAVTVIGLAAPGAARADLVWFQDQTAFENAMLAQGKLNKAIETFEENTVPNGEIGLIKNPLQGGVANGPFPNGLDASNLTVQTNRLGGNPTVPDVGDIMALPTPGVLGVTSDVVIAGASTDSLDLIFNDSDKTGIGFDAVTVLANDVSGGISVEVRVYNTSNALLGMFTSPADPVGSNFLGVLSTEPIGRINIWDPVEPVNGAGVEGADNIQMWAVPEPATALLLLVGGSLIATHQRRKTALVK